MDDIKPCPFCGGEATLYKDNCTIGCPGCEAEHCNQWWNHRHPSIDWRPVSEEPPLDKLGMWGIYYLYGDAGTAIDKIYRHMGTWYRAGRFSELRKSYDDWHHATRHWTHWTDRISGPETKG